MVMKPIKDTADYLLLINGDQYMIVIGEFRKFTVKALEHHGYTVEHCCTDCKIVMPRGEEEANWCQECSDADMKGIK